MSTPDNVSAHWAKAPRVLVARDADGLTRGVAERIIDTLLFRLKDEWVTIAHLAVSGGALMEGVWAALADSSRKEEVSWDKVHVWWVEERYYPTGHIGRNDTHAYAAGLGRVGIPPENIHPVTGPTPPVDGDLERAAHDYARLLARLAPEEREVPVFDLTLIAPGPKGEVGALYPGREPASATTVLAVDDAPHQSKERVTMTLSTLNVSTRTWLMAAGTEYAVSVGRALTGASAAELPAAGVRGVIETLWWLDTKAARAVPPEARAGDLPDAAPQAFAAEEN